ncbi:MAG TPA: carbonic anhydrase family protein [Chitinophagaceae bacterium]|nr:carbonic anhydrase family protein [Chitinophagaceae bacterium]
MRTHTKEFQQNLTPTDAFEVLKEGNRRFINNLKLNRDLLQQMDETASGQYPFAVTLSCMDSRTSIEHIFDQGLGDIFSIRIAGNVVNEDIVGSIEYACKVAGSKLIVVLGHSKCGAIKGACDAVEMGSLTGLLEKVKPALEKTAAEAKETTKEQYAEVVAQANVLESMREILEKSTILRNMYNEGKIGIVGGMYHVENGRVSFIRQLFAEEAVLQEEKASA